MPSLRDVHPEIPAQHLSTLAGGSVIFDGHSCDDAAARDPNNSSYPSIGRP